MKVEIGNVWSAVDAVQESSADSIRKSTDQVGGGFEADQAQLSKAAVLAGNLHQKLNGVPETREARVEELKQRVQKGGYQVSSEQIATALRADFTGMSRVSKGRQ